MRSEMPRGRLLVVDDNVDVLDAIQLVLEDLGQDVETSLSGAEALEKIRRGARYDLVLCDVGMPEMNGWEVAEAIRGLVPDARVVMLTGGCEQIPRADPRRALVSGILGKPIALEDLERVIASSVASA